MVGPSLLALALGSAMVAGLGAGTPDLKALKGRSTAPQAADFDPDATLGSLLQKKRSGDHSSAKAAVLEAYVLKAEREEDGDWALVLGPGPTCKLMQRVLVEVPAAWQARNPKLAPAALTRSRGHKVRVTGWLLYDTSSDDRDSRGTLWELHPVTDLERLD